MGGRAQGEGGVGQRFTQCSDTKQFRKIVPWLPEVEGEKILLF